MSYFVGGAILGSAVIGAGSSYLGSQAAEQGSAQGLAQNQLALRGQTALTNQQLELQRPVIQTRDAALNQLNQFFGLPTTTPSRTSFGSGAQGAIALNGITTRQDAHVDGGKDIRQGVFYDPQQHAIVAGDGSLIANVPPGGGLIPQLTSGKNNQVGVTADGQIYQIGSSGEQIPVPGLTQRLVQQAPEAQGAQGPNTGGPDFANILNLPIFDFQRKQGQKVINQNLAQKNKFFSGERGTALLNFNNQLVANRIGEDFVNPRLTLAGYGAQAAGSASNALGGLSNNIGANAANAGNLLQNQANARASGYAGINDSVQQGIGNYLQSNYLNQLARQNGNSNLGGLSQGTNGYYGPAAYRPK